jgi:tetratricopeptide (TPR) repeat protein
MAIWDWFRSRSTLSRPDELRTALFDALERKDYERAMRLINENSDRISSEFRSWTTLPESLRGNADAVGRYAKTLMTIARVFEKAGDASLRIWFEGGGRDGPNPFTQWTEALQQAGQLTESGQADEAVVLLRATLENIATATGTATDDFRAKCLGSLGVALNSMGNTSEAVRVTREALEICRQAGDDEGVKAYTTNLDVIGSFEIADPGSGHRSKVVIRDSDGRTLLPEELPGFTGRFTWQIRDARRPHPEAERLHEEGRAAGQKGDHDTAIALFTKAAQLDPSWPYPVYDRAYAHLLKEQYDAALADYRKTLELAPHGYFTAATAADTLTREAAGEFPPGLYAAFATLEHMPPEQQQSIAAQLVEKFPSHAPAWAQHARFLENPSDRLAAIEHGLLARPDPDTRGSLLVEKALALHASGERELALDILDQLTGAVGNSAMTQVRAVLAAAVIRPAGTGGTPC